MPLTARTIAVPKSPSAPRRWAEAPRRWAEVIGRAAAGNSDPYRVLVAIASLDHPVVNLGVWREATRNVFRACGRSFGDSPAGMSVFWQSLLGTAQ